jgi:hypothetical protein
MNVLITKIERELSQVPGLSVQVYAKENIAQKIASTFELIYDSKPWKRFNVRETHTLDGVTGVITDTFQKIFSFDDILRVYPTQNSIPLRKLPLEYNPQLEYGGLPRYYEYNGDPGKLITVHPAAASGDIEVIGLSHPTEFLLTDVVPFDEWALIWGVSWQYMLDDQSNPGAVKKFEQLFNTRMGVLYKNQTQEPLSLVGNRSGEYPTQWSDAG